MKPSLYYNPPAPLTFLTRNPGTTDGGKMDDWIFDRHRHHLFCLKYLLNKIILHESNRSVRRTFAKTVVLPTPRLSNWRNLFETQFFFFITPECPTPLFRRDLLNKLNTQVTFLSGQTGIKELPEQLARSRQYYNQEWNSQQTCQKKFYKR